MSKVKVEKKRTSNFSSDEKRILTELVLKYQKIIENKKSDATTNAEKLKGWIGLAEEFNNISTYCNRNHATLKCCWENIKRQAKKDRAAMKKKIFMTGGGKPPSPPSSQGAGSVVDTILGPALEGIPNIYDSDAAMTNETSECASAAIDDSQECFMILEDEDYSVYEVISEENNKAVLKQESNSTEEPTPCTSKDIIKENNMVSDKWTSWTPKNLKTPVSSALQVSSQRGENDWLKRRRPKNECSSDILIQEKINLVKLLQENALKEGAVRIAILEEQLKQEKIKTQKLENS